MYQVSKTFKISYAHRLLNHPGKCKYLHGHNTRIVVTYQSPTLNDFGMVMDFDDISKAVKPILDQLDHSTILQITDPLYKELCTLLQEGTVTYPRVVECSYPPTAEVLATWLADKLFPKPYQVDWWETDDNCGTWMRQ